MSKCVLRQSMLAEFEKLPMELYALNFNNALPTYLSLAWLIKQHHSRNTMLNKGLRLGTNWQPCGRHRGVCLIKKLMTTQHPKITLDDIKKAYLAKEWNSFHLLRNIVFVKTSHSHVNFYFKAILVFSLAERTWTLEKTIVGKSWCS